MRKILSVFISVVLLFSTALICGCTAKKLPNSTSDIEIIFWQSGYGRAYMDAIIEEFNKTNSDYKAHINASTETRGNLLYLDPDTNTADLFITSFETRYAYTEFMEPLDDLLKIKPDGESGKIIAEKIGSYVDTVKYEDGHVYAIKGITGAITGLLYNEDIFTDKNGSAFKVPNTTNELVDLALSINSEGKVKVPFVSYSEYWDYVFESWVAQYDGEEVFLKNWDSVYVDGSGTEYPNDVRSITGSQGRYEAYKVIANLISPDGYAYPNTNTFSHTLAQTYFLEGKAVMMPGGSWIENENRDKDKNIKIMKTPVISALGTKLGITDDILSLIVDYVDGERTLTSAELTTIGLIENSVIEEVRKARNIHYGGKTGDVFIPNYSNAKEGAFKFLEFFYSDKAMEIAENITESFLSVDYSVEPTIDRNSWSSFMKNAYDISKTANMINTSMNNPITYLNTLKSLYHNSPIIKLMFVPKGQGNTMTVDEYWNGEKQYWNEEWNTYKSNAGLGS